MVLSDHKCVALILYCSPDKNADAEDEEDKKGPREMPEPTFLLRQLPSLYRTETRYALVVYDKSCLTLNASGVFEETVDISAVKKEVSGNSSSDDDDDPEDEDESKMIEEVLDDEGLDAPDNEQQCQDIARVPTPGGWRKLDPEWEIRSLQGLPLEVLEATFQMLDAEALCHASISGRRFIPFGRDNRMWKNLCQSKWQVHFNELHMPKNFYNEPREMYKFMTTVWRRVQKQCRQQQRVAALATVLRLPQETVQEVLLLCNT